MAEACRLGAYRRAHRASDGQRHVRAELAVREALWEPVNAQIAAADARLAQVAAGDTVVAQLMTTPGIGPVTAAAIAILQATHEHRIDGGAGDDPQLARSCHGVGQPPVGDSGTHAALNDQGKR